MLYRHALRNALLPMAVLVFLSLLWLLSGAVVLETLLAWLGMERLLYQALTQKNFPVVQGLPLMIALATVLANLIATNLVLVRLTLPSARLTALALSFLGFGVQPPAADWDAMLNEGRLSLQQAPWISTFPGLAILFTVVCFNLLGDGMRNAFDPQQKL